MLLFCVTNYAFYFKLRSAKFLLNEYSKQILYYYLFNITTLVTMLSILRKIFAVFVCLLYC